MKYQYSLANKQNQADFHNMLTAMSYHQRVKLDHRIQVKMPRRVVEALAQTFPHHNRSQILTQLALTSIIEHLRFADRPDLGSLNLSQSDQAAETLNYLEQRDAVK